MDLTFLLGYLFLNIFEVSLHHSSFLLLFSLLILSLSSSFPYFASFFFLLKFSFHYLCFYFLVFSDSFFTFFECNYTSCVTKLFIYSVLINYSNLSFLFHLVAAY